MQHYFYCCIYALLDNIIYQDQILCVEFLLGLTGVFQWTCLMLLFSFASYTMIMVNYAFPTRSVYGFCWKRRRWRRQRKRRTLRTARNVINWHNYSHVSRPISQIVKLIFLPHMQKLEVRVHYFSQSENVYHNNLQGINIVKLQIWPQMEPYSGFLQLFWPKWFIIDVLLWKMKES